MIGTRPTSRLGETIDRFVTGTYIVTRRSSETVDAAGMSVLADPTIFKIDASIQPITGRELEQLPEGQRSSEVRLVLTRSEMRTRLPGNAPDVITYQGETWTVFRVERWPTHYRAWITRDVQTP